jgi:hypothetical protein
VRLHPSDEENPSDEEVAPSVSRETVVYNRYLHHEMIQPAKQRPWPRSQESRLLLLSTVRTKTQGTARTTQGHSRPPRKHRHDCYLHLH